MNKHLFVTKSFHYHENLKAGFNISVLYLKKNNSSNTSKHYTFKIIFIFLLVILKS